MNAKPDDRLLAAIDAIYATALSPEEYERFADIWDAYVAGLAPDAPGALRVLEHIDKALAIVERLHSSPAAEPDIQQLVRAEICAAAVSNADGVILSSNDAWRKVAGAGQSLWSLTDDPDEREALKGAVRRLHDVTNLRTSLARLSDAATGEPRLVAVRRLPNAAAAEPGDALHLIRFARSLWSLRVEAWLTAEFALTAAEAALLKRMTEGRSFAEIARETGRAVETLKSQSKSIYSKMNVSGREDAIRTALYLHLFMDATSERPSPPGERAGQIAVLPDGRRIVWAKRGAENGRPFLFLHGMSLGHGLTGAFEKHLSDRNLTAICIDRPGYGRSDPPRDWRRCVEEWCDLFPHLLASLDIERVPIITHTSGVMHACAAAAARPAFVSGVCALAGGVPITDVEMLSAYPAQTRVISRTAQFSPVALRFVIASAAAFYHRALGTDRLIKRTYSATPSDARALEDAEIYDLVRNGMEMISTGGLDGFVGDACRIFGDWSEYIAGMKAPLLYVIGEEDPICPLAWARAFAQRHTHVSVEPIAGAGQLLHHARPIEVVDAIAGFIDAAS